MERAQRNLVTVVGGGFAGLTSALSLRQKGFNVALLLTEALKAASWAAQGVSSVKGIFEADSPLFSLKLEGHRRFLSYLEAVEKISGETCPKIMGVSEYFSTLRQFREEFGRTFRHDFTGLKGVEFLGQRQDVVEFFYPEDFWVDTDSYLRLLKKSCLALGVTFKEGQLLKIDSKKDEEPMSLELTDGTSFHSDRVVLCLGRDLENIQGIAAPALIEVPGNTYHMSLPKPQKNKVIVKKLHSLTVADQRLILGSSSLKSSTQEEKPLSDLDPMIQSFPKEKELLTSASSSCVARYGVRVRFKDRTPQVSSLDEAKRIWINTGYYKSGLTLSPLFAEKLAEKISRTSLKRQFNEIV